MRYINPRLTLIDTDIAMFNLFRLCQKDETSFDIDAKSGNIVEATFDFVEKIV